MYATQPKKTWNARGVPQLSVDNQPLLKFPPGTAIGSGPSPPSGPPQKQLFLNQSRSSYPSAPKSSIASPGAKSIDDPDKYCRSNFTVFGQITFPIIILILLLIIASVIIFFSVRYYRSKVLLASSSLISTPTNLGNQLRVANSNNSPTMLSNQFSYLFWLRITPPTSNSSSSNSLVFIRDSDTFPPRFCVYISNNGATLNVASLYSGDYSNLTEDQKTYIYNLYFDKLPDIYLVSSTSQISFYTWLFVTIVGQRNQLVIFIGAQAYDSQVQNQNRTLQMHSGYIDIAYKNNNSYTYNFLDDSYISKLIVYNYPVTQSQMQNIQKYNKA